VIIFQYFEATDPRDTIYSLLSLARDGHFTIDTSESGKANNLISDYTKDPLQVYIRFVQHCIQSSDSLDILCSHWAQPLSSTRSSNKRKHVEVDAATSESDDGYETSWFPSWIGLLTDSSYGPPSKSKGRINGDSFCGIPHHRIYSASRGKSADIRFGMGPAISAKLPTNGGMDRDRVPTSSTQGNPKDQPTQSTSSDDNKPTSNEMPDGSSSWPDIKSNEFNGSLWARGLVLGTVSRISSQVVDGTVPDEFLRMAGWNREEDINTIPDYLWRTLVADRGEDGNLPPFWYRRACMYALTQASSDGHLNTTKLVSTRSLPRTVIRYLRRVQQVVWSRRFFHCKESSSARPIFGIGPKYMKNKDVICLLYGCSVPVVLRQHSKRDLPYYELIGECFAYEKMDGEAVAHDSVRLSDIDREFHLR
jgi:hypothetical protein